MAAKKDQSAALKYLLFRSNELSDLFKRVLATLIDQSDGLKRPVQIRLSENVHGYSRAELKELYHNFSIATSSGCNTHLHALLHLAGSTLQFNYSQGNTDCVCGFWSRSGKEPTAVGVHRNILDQIDLSKPGLYDEHMPRRFKKAG
jgi:hypothetical protein